MILEPFKLLVALVVALEKLAPFVERLMDAMAESRQRAKAAKNRADKQKAIDDAFGESFPPFPRER